MISEDGQLALPQLAVRSLQGMLPKIETHGQLGKARWRLVSAPFVNPHLLSMDPVTDPLRSLTHLTVGTEVEVQFGNTMVTLTRQLRDAEAATLFTLLYQLRPNLRFHITNACASNETRVLFEYSNR